MKVFSEWERPPFVIAVLRQPADRIHSSFRYTQGNLAKIGRTLDFSDYVDALLMGEADKLTGQYLSQSNLWIAVRELMFSRYVVWLDRWESLVGRDNLTIILFEELKENPRKVLNMLCGRLDLNPSFYNGYQFQVRNLSVSPRSQRLHRLARKIGGRVPASSTKSTLRKAYNRVQIDFDENGRAAEGGLALRKLDEYFLSWNEALASRFDLDLRSWQVSR